MRSSSNGIEKSIYKKCISKNITIKHACEVGVFLPEMSNIYDFITKTKTKTILVEPDPKSIAAIKKTFGNYDNVTLYPVAIYDHNGKLELVQREASTFAANLSASPALINDNYEIKEEDKFTVECKTFNEIDDGTIDLLSIDTEGCEWFVLKYLKSRPLIISLETHGNKYVNPYYAEIIKWMSNNNYVVWFADRSDSVYCQKGAFKISMGEKIKLQLTFFFIKFRRFRKNFF